METKTYTKDYLMLIDGLCVYDGTRVAYAITLKD